MNPPLQLAAAALAGDRRAASRLISLAEAGDPLARAEFRLLYKSGKNTPVIGVTGPPGAGKSTLIDSLIECLRRVGLTVAVLAVDPSSPLSGGALLGDRVRMSRRAEDRGVLIRSMAARGALGGLSNATGDALTVLDTMGFDRIILETVGVGQSEIEVLNHADLVLLLQTAQSGDAVQMIKAGILEIADILVLNKADADGSQRMANELAEMVAHRQPTSEGWQTPVISTEAAVGKNVSAVLQAIDAFLDCQAAHPQDALRRRRGRVRTRLLALALTKLRERTEDLTKASLLQTIDAVIDRQLDPHDAAERLAHTAWN